MHILAHRGYSEGPDPTRENTLDAVRECLERGWGVEIDIRRAASGAFYIAHDASSTGAPDAVPYLEAIRRASAPVALNVKELGYEADLLAFLRAHDVLDHLFLFDMELIEPVPGATAARFRALDPAVRLAARASDRAEPLDRALSSPNESVVWLDEFDRLWIERHDIAAVHAAGRQAFAISPEIHGFPIEAAVERWQQFLAWGLDGLCTDYPARAQRALFS